MTALFLLPPRAVPAARLSFFFRDLANMLVAGIALNHALGSLKEAVLDPRLSRGCAVMLLELAAGRPLAQAMGQTGLFPRLALNAVKAGEHAGNLPLVMGLLADHFDLSARLKDKCLQAVIYPASVIGLLLVVLIYMAQAVVPQLAPLLPPEALDNWLTRALITFSAFIVHAGGWLFGGTAVLGLTMMGLISRYPDQWHAFLNELPLVGRAHRDLEIALCFFDIFVLLRSGIPLDTALTEAAAAAVNRTGMELKHCRQYLAGGHTFSAALAVGKYFPRLVVETVRLGEETGHYDEYCERVFKFYYRSFETRVGLLAATLQPALLGVAAFFVMLMALAFLKPIYANLTHIGVLKP